MYLTQYARHRSVVYPTHEFHAMVQRQTESIHSRTGIQPLNPPDAAQRDGEACALSVQRTKGQVRRQQMQLPRLCHPTVVQSDKSARERADRYTHEDLLAREDERRLALHLLQLRILLARRPLRWQRKEQMCLLLLRRLLEVAQLGRYRRHSGSVRGSSRQQLMRLPLCGYGWRREHRSSTVSVKQRRFDTVIVCTKLRTTARTSRQRASSGNLGLYRARRRAGAVLRHGHDANIRFLCLVVSQTPLPASAPTCPSAANNPSQAFISIQFCKAASTGGM